MKDRIQEIRRNYDADELMYRVPYTGTASTATKKYTAQIKVALTVGKVIEDCLSELTALRKGEEKTKEVLHRQFAKVHKLQEGYEALRKENEALREAIDIANSIRPGIAALSETEGRSD